MTTVKVSWENIRKGEVGTCQFCAIALALKDLLNEEYYPHVSSSHVKFKLTNSGEEVEYRNLPERAMKFIQLFDAPAHPFGSKPQPFEFNLDIPRYMLKDASKTGAH